jgi:hypothetical protein
VFAGAHALDVRQQAGEVLVVELVLGKEKREPFRSTWSSSRKEANAVADNCAASTSAISRGQDPSHRGGAGNPSGALQR